jgi:hypothetical protein
MTRTTAANTTLNPAPVTITRIGISSSNALDGEVVVSLVVLEDEVVSILVSLVVLEVPVDVVVVRVAVCVTDVIVAVLVCVKLVVADSAETGTEPLPARARSATIVKVSKGSELAPELALFVRTDDWAPPTNVRNGCRHMTFSVSGTSVYQERAVLLIAYVCRCIHPRRARE